MPTSLSWNGTPATIGRRRRMPAPQVGPRHHVDWLTLLLVGGLIATDLAAFGVAYRLATIDVLAEVTGEVRADWPGVPGTTLPPHEEPTTSHKRSSLSRRSEPVPVNEARPNVSLPLPAAPVNDSKPSEATAIPSVPAAPKVLETPLASPSTAPLPDNDQVSNEAPAPTRETGEGTGPRRDAESP